VLSAVVLGVGGATIGWTWTLPAYVVFFLALTVISVIDLRHYLIPNRVVYPALYATFVLLVAAAIIEGSGHHLVDALIGMACAWFFFFVVWFIYPRGMGFGDVRLSALVGLVSGWVGLGNVVLSVLLALLIGAFVGVALIVVRLRSRKQAIPFGPFLALGATISVLWGAQLMR
jgi:leader peptidase (prepilin peptidase) / N-methyltransferase